MLNATRVNLIKKLNKELENVPYSEIKERYYKLKLIEIIKYKRLNISEEKAQYLLELPSALDVLYEKSEIEGVSKCFYEPLLKKVSYHLRHNL